MAVKVLTKKFGTLSKEDLAIMATLNITSLELIIEEFWQYETLEALKQKYF
jgi:cell division protein ZapA (FtsZ GTPase activity inhibitor)